MGLGMSWICLVSMLNLVKKDGFYDRKRTMKPIGLLSVSPIATFLQLVQGWLAAGPAS